MAKKWIAIKYKVKIYLENIKKKIKVRFYSTINFDAFIVKLKKKKNDVYVNNTKIILEEYKWNNLYDL